MKSYINLFRNYANFSGYLKRGEYWRAVLIHLVILLGPLVPAVMFLADEKYTLPGFYIPWVLPFWCFYVLLTRIPLLSAAVRRFHTLPRKGWWLLVALIPVAGWFIVLIWLLQKGSYDALEKRLKILMPKLAAAANRPRNGGWFFAAMVLLAAGGFFLNRQVQKSDETLALVKNIQSGAPVDLASLNFRNGGTAAKAPDASATAAANVSVTMLEPVEGESMTALKDESVLLPVSDDVLASVYAVTYGQYSACVRAGACEMPAAVNLDAYRKLDKNIFTFLKENGLKIGAYFDLLHQEALGYAENLPMVDVTAEQAAAYCVWAGMRLPTVSEWMDAADGASLSAQEANYIDYPHRWIPIRDNAQAKAQIAQTVPVTYDDKYASDHGMVAMTGNVWEWTAPEADGASVLALGGAWNSYPNPSLKEAVLETLPGYAANNIGFRCFVDADKLTSDLFKGGSPVQLAEADVTEADISDADVTEAEVSAADVTEIDVPVADVSEADLAEADVTEADVFEADDAADIIPDAGPLKAAASDAGSKTKTDSGADTKTSPSGEGIAETESKPAEETEEQKPEEQPDGSGTFLDGIFSFVNRIKTDSGKAEEEIPDNEHSGEENEGSAAPTATAQPTAVQPTAATVLTATPQPTPTEAPDNHIQLSEGASVIAKADGAILRQTENDVLAALYAVTVGQYSQCVDAGVCEMPKKLESLAYPGILDGSSEENDAENLPMVYVTQDQAAAYCGWAGMRLPTEAEWKAAAAMSDGAKLSEKNVNCIGTDRKTLIQDAARKVLTVPVTSFRRNSASVYGMVQMAGNVWEWTANGEDDGTALALGGGWNSYPDAVGTGAEMLTLADYAADNIGFRCFADADMITTDDFELSEVSPAVLANPDLWREEGLRVMDDAEMAYIPAGTFTMGVSNGAVDEKPAHEVTLSAYWIDIYEVTNRQYALCVADGACTLPHETKSFRNASYYGNPDFDDYPVVAVDRDQAEAYCSWANTRLPTEAEWEYAAKGPDGNAYPWGTTFDSKVLNYSGNGNYDTLAVTANPDDVSDFGIFDLGGNVAEWIRDRYQDNWYTVTDQPADPTGPSYGSYYVIRGSSAQGPENNARTADRFYAINTSYALDRGFRCAVSEDQE